MLGYALERFLTQANIRAQEHVSALLRDVAELKSENARLAGLLSSKRDDELCAYDVDLTVFIEELFCSPPT